jgi:hypothetical protein
MNGFIVIASERSERGNLSRCLKTSEIATSPPLKRWRVLAMTIVAAGLCRFSWAAPTPHTPTSVAKPVVPEEMEVQVKGQFRGRLMVKKIVAPVTMNLEKLQDFPEDPAQKILIDPLPISQAGEFNARAEVRGHAPFVPWLPALPEPPFLRMVPPKLNPKGPKLESWIFEVLNPQGQTIFRQRGMNFLPDEVIWEGKDSEKKFAVVDRLYSAQLTMVNDDGRATLVSGESVILPAMIYGSAASETVEFSLSRLFLKDKADISPEGIALLSKFGERIRELGLSKMHLRISGRDPALSAQRETELVRVIDLALQLVPGSVEHDHAQASGRGEIAVFWLKRGGGK